MRTIVPFVLCPIVFSISLCAQPNVPQQTPQQSQQIERLEKRIADSIASVQDRAALVNLYFIARNPGARREQVLWLIEHQPDLVQHRSPSFAMDRYAVLPDPSGFAQADRLWREQGMKPGATAKAIASAIRFFRFEDREEAKRLLEAGERSHSGDPDLVSARGELDAMALGGLVMTAPGVFAGDKALQRLPEAAKARKEIESSTDIKLIASAAGLMTERYFAFNDAPALNGDDPLDLAERWLQRALEKQSENKELKSACGLVYEREAALAADPKWKVQLLRKADAMIDNWFGLPQLALAEFDAGNDDAALKVAQRMLDRKPQPPNFANSAHTIRGLVALEQKKITDAKAELLESARINGVFEPERTLAQALMDAGERDIVIQFFETSRSFWKNDQGAIDHYIRMVKAPGTHDITTRFFPGQDVRGRPAPKLPIDDYTGKAVAVQFRNAACKECAKEFEALNRAVSSRGVVDTWIDFQGNESLVNQYQIETFPTVVLIDMQGRVADFIPGHLDERLLDQRLEQLALRGPRQLPAPKPIAVEKLGTLAWSPIAGAESYVVQWDQRDDKGWLSDRDDHLVRVIPTHESSVTLDPALGETNSGTIRWRVFAVNRIGAGSMSEWREMSVVRP